jgi:hypothetical protein
MAAPVRMVPADIEVLPAAGWVVFGEDVPAAAMARIGHATAEDRVLVIARRGTGRNREVDLASTPVPLDRAVVAFRADLLGRLRPDRDLDPDLALALLVARYLLTAPTGEAAVVPLRTPSAAAPDWQRPERYSVAPARWVELLAELDDVPPWLQHLAVDQLIAYVREDGAVYMTTAALPPEVTGAWHAAAAAILEHVDDEIIRTHPAAGVTDAMRLALLLGLRGRRGHGRVHRRRDAARGLDRVSYLFSGAPPPERVVGTPGPAKVRRVDVLGRDLLGERIVWVPSGADVEVGPDGLVELPPPPAESRVARARRVVRQQRGIAPRVLRDLRIRRRARRHESVERYRDAWLLMDRDNAAQDNAEHLYRHLRAHEPDVNAFFVLADDSPDWPRLRAEDFRLIPFGSDEHFVALLHCAQLASSQVDSYVVNPFRGHLLGPVGFRFTFLQHGVTKHDLSRWLNTKPIDLFVTSTPDEHAAIAGDGSPYVLTDLEVRMTGMARHDRLHRLATGTTERTRLLVMPTWRRELLGAQTRGGNQRELLDSFWTSDYALAWRRFLESDRLRALCDAQGWELDFVPHPNMQEYLDTSPLPAHVTAWRFSEVDIQQLLAEAGALVTDYSSLAIDAAYAERPVVYYHFDRDTFFAGGHLYRRGVWSYERQGYGPIVTTADEVIDALERIAADRGPAPEYARRMQQTFPFRDGQCCARTVAAMREFTPRTEPT